MFGALFSNLHKYCLMNLEGKGQIMNLLGDRVIECWGKKYPYITWTKVAIVIWFLGSLKTIGIPKWKYFFFPRNYCVCSSTQTELVLIPQLHTKISEIQFFYTIWNDSLLFSYCIIATNVAKRSWWINTAYGSFILKINIITPKLQVKEKNCFVKLKHYHMCTAQSRERPV